MLVVLFVLLDQAAFLSPYRAGLMRNHGWFLVGYAVAFFFNLALAFDLVVRKSFLKDAGRKLHHFDRELHTRENEISHNVDLHFGD